MKRVWIAPEMITLEVEVGFLLKTAEFGSYQS